jgi:hypothetical protein
MLVVCNPNSEPELCVYVLFEETLPSLHRLL